MIGHHHLYQANAINLMLVIQQPERQANNTWQVHWQDNQNKINSAYYRNFQDAINKITLLNKLNNKTMFKVIINKGLGFTETTKTFNSLQDACAFSVNFDNVKIYKGKKRVF